MHLLPDLLTRNWKLKAAAFALALLLWTSLRFEATDRQTLPSVPVRVQLNDPQWAVAGNPDPPSVAVRVSGPARDLFNLFLQRPTLIIPVDEVGSNDTTVVIRPEWLRLPTRAGVSVEEIEPNMARLAFEPIEQAEVPLALRTSGSVPEGFALGEEPSLDPSFTRVSGPASRVHEVDSLPLLTLDLSDFRETETRSVQVDTAGFSGIVISPVTTEVTVRVDERVERIVTGIAVELPLGGEIEVEVRPREVTATLTGARTRIGLVDPENLRAMVPVGEVTALEPEEERRVPVTLEGLPPLTEGSLEPDSVTVLRPPPQ